MTLPGYAASPASVEAEGTGVDSLIGSLCGQIEAAEDKAERWREDLITAKRQVTELREAYAQAIEALRPFAVAGAGISNFWDGERRANSLDIQPVRVRHYRRAGALVELADARSANPQAGTTEQSALPREAVKPPSNTRSRK